MYKYIKKLFFAAKLSSAKQLCHDIQEDYYKIQFDGRYKCSHNNDGFLEEAFSLKRDGIKVFSSNQTNEGFQLDIKEFGNKESIFCVKIIYGELNNDSTKSVLYINDFSRLSDERNGYGKTLATLIKQFAENRKFDFIEIHPVACKDVVIDAMNQEQLEQFYRKIFNSKIFTYKEVENSSDIKYIEYDKRWE